MSNRDHDAWCNLRLPCNCSASIPTWEQRAERTEAERDADVADVLRRLDDVAMPWAHDAAALIRQLQADRELAYAATSGVARLRAEAEAAKDERDEAIKLLREWRNRQGIVHLGEQYHESING